MSKVYDEEDFFVPSDAQDTKLPLRTDNELFNEDDRAIVHSVINVKRIKLPKNGEDWEILVDGKSAVTMKGTRFTNAERDFLRSVEGMKFLVSEYKKGRRSVVKIKEELKRMFP